MADKPTLETRTVTAAIELREVTDAAPVLTGYAATFGRSYRVGHFEERIDPSAFARTLAGNPDVRLLIDHEGQPLARTKSGTLTLSTDAHGLQVRAELDQSDPDVQRLLPKMRRGDLDQMSFAFWVPSGGDEWDYSGDVPQRTVREAALHGGDVSVVTYPANEDALASVRARDEKDAAFTFAAAVLQEVRGGAKLRKAQRAAFRDTLADLGLLRRSMSYNDREQALSDALMVKYAPTDDDNDACMDMWLVDAADDWVIWRVYGDTQPGIGLWRVGYSMDADGAVTFDGDPVKVVASTVYNPAPQTNSVTSLDLARRQAQALALRAAKRA